MFNFVFSNNLLLRDTSTEFFHQFMREISTFFDNSHTYEDGNSLLSIRRYRVTQSLCIYLRLIHFILSKLSLSIKSFFHI